MVSGSTEKESRQKVRLGVTEDVIPKRNMKRNCVYICRGLLYAKHGYTSARFWVLFTCSKGKIAFKKKNGSCSLKIG